MSVPDDILQSLVERPQETINIELKSWIDPKSPAAELQDLVSASNDFEVEMIEHEHVLEQNPSATELAASTLKYAKAKERYFAELRNSVPTLVDMATGKTPKVDKIREIFSGYGEAQGR